MPLIAHRGALYTGGGGEASKPHRCRPGVQAEGVRGRGQKGTHPLHRSHLAGGSRMRVAGPCPCPGPAFSLPVKRVCEACGWAVCRCSHAATPLDLVAA